MADEDPVAMLPGESLGILRTAVTLRRVYGL